MLGSSWRPAERRESRTRSWSSGHARRQTSYAPDAEDWFWYAGLPLVGYAGLLAAAILLAWHPTASLFVIATTSLLLLFIGIHNAWDTVTYIAVEHRQKRREKGH